MSTVSMYHTNTVRPGKYIPNPNTRSFHLFFKSNNDGKKPNQRWKPIADREFYLSIYPTCLCVCTYSLTCDGEIA